MASSRPMTPPQRLTYNIFSNIQDQGFSRKRLNCCVTTHSQNWIKNIKKSCCCVRQNCGRTLFFEGKNTRGGICFVYKLNRAAGLNWADSATWTDCRSMLGAELNFRKECNICRSLQILHQAKAFLKWFSKLQQDCLCLLSTLLLSVKEMHSFCAEKESDKRTDNKRWRSALYFFIHLLKGLFMWLL